MICKLHSATLIHCSGRILGHIQWQRSVLCTEYQHRNFPNVETRVVPHRPVTIRPINIRLANCMFTRERRSIARLSMELRSLHIRCFFYPFWTNVKSTAKTLLQTNEVLFKAVLQYVIPKSKSCYGWTLFVLISRQHVFHWCLITLYSYTFIIFVKISKVKITCFERLTVFRLG